MATQPIATAIDALVARCNNPYSRQRLLPADAVIRSVALKEHPYV